MKSPVSRSGNLRVFRFTQGNGKPLDLKPVWETLAERLTSAQPYSSSRAIAKEETKIGWIDTDLYYVDDYAAFVWEVTKRKVPRSAVEELMEARIRGLGLERISRKMRTEIKEDVTQDLLQRALPDKRDHVAAIHRENGMLYVQGLSQKHARSLATWLRRQMQDLNMDVGVPCEVLAEMPGVVIDHIATMARGEGEFGLWKLKFDGRTAVLSDSRGSIKVNHVPPKLGDDEEDNAPSADSLLDQELSVSEERQIVSCRIETMDGNEITVARYIMAADKPPVINLPVGIVGVGGQLVELVRAWEWLYKLVEMAVDQVPLHANEKEHAHQVAALLRPYA